MSTVTKPILLNETGQAMVTALEAIADGFDYLKATSVTVNGTTYEQEDGNIDIGTVIRAHQDVSGKLDKSGGTMTGTLTLSNTTILPAEGSIRVGSSSGLHIFRESAGTVYIGSGSEKMRIQGSETRPKYYDGSTSSDMALYSDLSGKMDKPTIKTTLDAVAEVNTQYYLGDRSSNVSLTLPDNAATGSLITVVFYPTTSIDLVIQGDIIGEIPVPEAGQRIELNMLWDSKYWTLVSNVQDVPEASA